MTNCKTCVHRIDLNEIIPWSDPSRMFHDWKCFYDIKSDFESVLIMYNKDEGKSMPDLRYDLYNHKWIQLNFKCPMEKI